jgi:hypothetical protein
MRHVIRSLSTTGSLDARRRRVALAVIVLFASVLAISSIAVAASAGENSHDRHEGRTIYLHSTLVSATVNSAGKGGAGDVVANLWNFTTRDGQTGHADISCLAFPNAERLCHAAFVFPKGQIDAQAAIPDGATTFVAAILGGTGIYEGVGGQAVNTVKAPGVIDRVVHLIPANH